MAGGPALRRICPRQGFLATPEGHCCLGVLCEIAVKEGVAKKGEKPYDYLGRPFIFYTTNQRGSLSLLPEGVAYWAGLQSENPRVEYNDQLFRLSDLNDHLGLNFKEIANVIEENFR